MQAQIVPPPVLKTGLRSKVRIFGFLIAIALLSIPLAAIMLYAVNVDDTVICTGTVVPEHTYELSAPFDGRVKELYFRTGAKVKKGDLLIQLDDAEYQNQARLVRAAIGILEAELQVAKSELEALEKEPLPAEYRYSETRLTAARETDAKAQEKLGRFRDLLQQNATSKIEFEKVEKEARDTAADLAIKAEIDRIVRSGLGGKIIEKAKNEIHVIERRIDEKKVQLGVYEQRISDCRILANENSTIVEIPCKKVMYAERGKPAIVLASLDLMVLAEVDSRFIRKVRLNQDAEISSEIFSRLQYGSFPAIVEKINDVPMDGTTKYPVYLRLDPEDFDIKLGSKAEVRIITGTSPAIYAFLNLSEDDDIMRKRQELKKRSVQQSK